MRTDRQLRTRAFDVSTRSVDGGLTEITGVAIVYDTPAYGEVIRHGAFTKSLQEQDVKMYWSHNTDLVLARTGNGTLVLEDLPDGLHVTARPNPDTTWGRDALASIGRGDVHQFSFAFAPVKGAMITENAEEVYEVREARLYEVSPVAEPWYEQTTASARNRCDEEVATSETAEAEPEPGQDPHSTQCDARARLALRLRLGATAPNGAGGVR